MAHPDDLPRKSRKKANTLLWLYEPLEALPRFVCQKFFFIDAAYINAKLYLGLVERGEPWNGLIVCTSREYHASLLNDFPQLSHHPVLGKWLYLSMTHPEFESTATALVALAEIRDERLGVETGTRKRAKSEAAKSRK